ncbi:PAS domain S-box protein [Candidatus Cryosericum septentrionale]|jgi:two-component system cell cycle sensor histidine kinase/response regulator CckA|nr:PAS domain S-box protein [Candidatus Cryosericum septentrionale]
MSAGETWALYRQALDASMDGMALLDSAGRYVYANAAHAAAYGFARAEDLIGQSWRILYDDEGLHFIDEQVFPILRSQGRWQGRAVGRRRDGSLFPQELSLVFLPDGGIVCVVRDISDRVKAEELARMSERIIERSSSVVFRCAPTPRWPVLYVSANVTAWGYRPEDLLSGNISFADIVHPEDIQRILGESAQYYATTLIRWNEHYRIVTADGAFRYVDDETIVTRNPDGSVQYAEGVLHDVTERVLAEQAQRLYLLLSENTHDIILFIAPNGSIREANTAACTAYGYAHDELLRLNIQDLRVPEARAAIPALFAQAINGSIVFETTHMRKDGSAFPVEVSSHGTDYNGEQVIISLIRDVTERRAREAEIAQLGRAVDESSDEIYVVDGDTLSCVQANLRAQQNLGYSLDELRQMKSVDVAPEMTAERLAEALELVRAGIRSTAMLRTTARRRDGTTYPVEARLSLAETGGKTAIVVIFTDISERLAAEAEHTLILTAMDQVSEGIVILDEDERLQYANQGLEHILGVPAASIMGKTLAELPAGPGFEELHRGAAAAVLSGQAWTGTLTMTRSDGMPLTLRASVRSIRQPEGQTRAYCVVIHDATEEVHREEELRQSQKMEAIGLLAGGIAHDFNNLLTAIMGYADLLTYSLPPGSPEAVGAATISQAAVKAADLTRRLLGFARKGKIEDVPVDLHSIIHDVRSLLERTIPRSIVITEELDAGQSSVLGDSTQLQQVLLNLAINARDAMPEGGTLSFKTRNVHLDALFCRLHPETREGWYLQTDVEDTGCGITAENMPHMFEPFFTTKGVGKGTGMGLAMVYGIVRNHGGTIHVYSEEARGSVFRMYLPFTETAAAPSSDSQQQPVSGHGRILVVDDEDVVLKVSADILRQLGYNVDECISGDAAVSWYATQPQERRPDLIVIDLNMPGMDGIQTLKALKTVDSGIRALLSTGFGLDGRLPEATAAGFAGWVQKPFHPYELSVAVAQALKTQH